MKHRQRGAAEDVLIIFAALFLIGLLVFAVLRTINALDVERQCLRLGFAESDVDWTLRGYCVKRDYRGEMYAVPVEDARRDRDEAQ